MGVGRRFGERECYSLRDCEGQTEKPRRICCRRHADVVRIVVTRFGELRDGVDDPRRLVPLAAIRNRSEVRGVRFDEQTVARHKPQQCEVRPLPERDDPTERNVPAGVEGKLRQLRRSRIAVQDTNDTHGSRFADNGACVIFSVPGVNDYRQMGISGKRYLREKRAALRVARRVVVVVIQTTLTYGYGPGLDEPSQPGDVTSGVELGGVVGMNARGGENEIGVFVGKAHRAGRGVDRLPNANQRRCARFAGAGNYRVAVTGERRVREVGVAVDEDCRAPVFRGHLRSIQRRIGAAT